MPVTVEFSQKRSITMMLQSCRASIDASAERRLIEFLSQAKQTLDIAIYDMRSRAVLEALTGIAKRARVRIIIDAGTAGRDSLPTLDPKAGTTLEALRDAGLAGYVTALYANGEQAMHHKFAVRDGEAVWTGGMNFTDGGLHLEDASAIVLESEPLAALYTTEFERLLAGRPVIDAPAETLIVGKGHKVSALFGSQIKAAILKALGGRYVKRVRMLAYAISDTELLLALQRFQPSDRDIRGIYDPHGMRRAKGAAAHDLWFLDDQRFTPAPSNAYHRYGEQNAFAQKVLIVNDTVFLGSWNFGDTDLTVDDNALQIEAPQVSTAMTRYFDTVAMRYRNYAQETWGG